MIEYSEFASEQSAQYSYASPGQFCFSMRFIRDLYEDLHAELPLHLAQKKALIIPVGKSTPEPSSIFKCETFQFDLLAFTEQSKALLCPRWRTYAPVKNAKGKNSPEEVKKAKEKESEKRGERYYEERVQRNTKSENAKKLRRKEEK